MSEAKTAGKDSDKDKNKDKVFPLTLESLVGPLKSQLLLLCRVAKEQLSDDNLRHVTLRFPASLIRRYSSDFVILRGEKIDEKGDIGVTSTKVDNDDAVEGEGERSEEEEEFEWSVVPHEGVEEGEERQRDLVIDILREEFEAACLPVLEVHHTTALHCTALHLELLLSCMPFYDSQLALYHLRIILPILFLDIT